jgi:hypothetical protein
MHVFCERDNAGYDIALEMTKQACSDKTLIYHAVTLGRDKNTIDVTLSNYPISARDKKKMRKLAQ